MTDKERIKKTKDIKDAWKIINERWESVKKEKRVDKKKLIELYKLEGETESYFLNAPMRHSNENTNHAIFKMVNSDPKRLLDIGCGSNPEIDISLSEMGNRVIGIELSETYARTAKKVCRKKSANIEIIVADGTTLPFKNGSFNGCICSETIEHVPDPENLVYEIHRILEPNGEAYVTVPNRSNILILFKKLRDRIKGIRKNPEEYYIAPSHLREYTMNEVKNLFESSKFRVIRVYGVEIPCRKSFKRVLRFFFNLPFLKRLSSSVAIKFRIKQH